MALRKEEITRKLLHLFALIMPAGIFYMPHYSLPWFVPSAALAFFLTGSIIFETLRFRIPSVQKLFFALFGTMLREEEQHKTTGSTYVLGAALICSLVFITRPYISFITLTLFILGDAIAAIVGLSIGKIKIGSKSLEGSLGCFFLCVVLWFGLFPFVPGLLDSWGGKVPLIMIFSSAVAVTLLELFPFKIGKFTINDNLAVPVLVGFLMIGIEKLLGL